MNYRNIFYNLIVIGEILTIIFLIVIFVNKIVFFPLYIIYLGISIAFISISGRLLLTIYISIQYGILNIKLDIKKTQFQKDILFHFIIPFISDIGYIILWFIDKRIDIYSSSFQRQVEIHINGFVSRFVKTILWFEGMAITIYIILSIPWIILLFLILVNWLKELSSKIQNVPISLEESTDIISGMLKLTNKISISDISELTNTSNKFWKRRIYALIGRGDIDGSFDGKIFELHEGADIGDTIDMLLFQFESFEDAKIGKLD